MIETWDEAGRPLLRIGDRVNRRGGFIDVDPANGPGSMQVPLFSEGAAFAYVVSLVDGNSDFLARPTTSGNTLSWAWGNLGFGDPVRTRIVYGVY